MEQLIERIYQDIKADLSKGRLVMPSLPNIVPMVWAMIEKPNFKANDLAVLIAKDPAISARLLAMANSAFYRRSSGKVTNIRTAIVRLGNNAIKQIVALLGVAKLYDVRKHPLIKPHLISLWNESTMLAGVSEVLASKTSHLKSETAMLAGLTCRVGALPLLVRAEKVKQLVEDQRVLNIIIEKLQVPVGTAILTRWQFPDELKAVVAEVDDLQRDSNSLGDYADVVQAARLVIHHGTEHPWGAVDWSEVPSMLTLGVEVEDVDGLLEFAGVRIGELRGLISFK